MRLNLNQPIRMGIHITRRNGNFHFRHNGKSILGDTLYVGIPTRYSESSLLNQIYTSLSNVGAGTVGEDPDVAFSDSTIKAVAKEGIAKVIDIALEGGDTTKQTFHSLLGSFYLTLCNIHEEEEE